MGDHDTYTVTCGSVIGELHMNRFICPGINQECIKVDGRFVSPKNFSFMGDKGKLKNWKNAVRINGKNIRKLMDTGELDFFNHSEVCTGKCMSRGSGVSKYDVPHVGEEPLGLDLAPMGGFASGLDNSLSDGSLDASPSQPVFPGQSLSPTPRRSPSLSPAPKGSGARKRAAAGSPAPEAITIKPEPIDDEYEKSVATSLSTGSAFPAISSTTGLPSTLPPGAIPIQVPNGRPPIGQLLMTSAGLIQLQPMMVGGSPALSGRKGVSSPGMKLVQEEPIRSVLDLPDDVDVMEDSQTFWQGILQVGLIDDFFREVKYGLDALKHELIRSRGGVSECQRSSRIVNQLGLVDKLKLKISAHKADTEKQKNKLDIELEVLRRRMQEAEQKQAQLNHKTTCFQNLIDASRPSKMARLESPAPSRSPTPSLMASAVASAPSSNSRAVAVTSAATPSIAITTTGSVAHNLVSISNSKNGTTSPVVMTPARSSRKSSNPTKTVEERSSSPEEDHNTPLNSSQVIIRRSSRSRTKPSKFNEYADGDVAGDLEAMEETDS